MRRQLHTEKRVLEAEKSVFLGSSHFVQFDVMNVRIESGRAMEGRRFSLGAGGTLMAGSSANYQGRELFFFSGAQFAHGTYRRVLPAGRAERISEIIITPEMEHTIRTERLDSNVAVYCTSIKRSFSK